eukprot:scaffold1784_cov364-Prasinococcus_capsulatus_cf.AAC.5
MQADERSRKVRGSLLDRWTEPGSLWAAQALGWSYVATDAQRQTGGFYLYCTGAVHTPAGA